MSEQWIEMCWEEKKYREISICSLCHENGWKLIVAQLPSGKFVAFIPGLQRTRLTYTGDEGYEGVKVESSRHFDVKSGKWVPSNQLAAVEQLCLELTGQQFSYKRPWRFRKDVDLRMTKVVPPYAPGPCECTK